MEIPTVYFGRKSLLNRLSEMAMGMTAAGRLLDRLEPGHARLPNFIRVHVDQRMSNTSFIGTKVLARL